MGEGVSDVSGQTEQTGGGLQGNWTVQVLLSSGFYLSFFCLFLCALLLLCINLRHVQRIARHLIQFERKELYFLRIPCRS